MIAFRIIATVLVAFSFFTCFLKNVNIFSVGHFEGSDKYVILSTIWGWLWRAFVIVAVWIV